MPRPVPTDESLLAPLHDVADLCWRCTKGAGPTCPPCVGEQQANRDDARDEIVRTVYTGHGINHGDYRTDVAL